MPTLPCCVPTVGCGSVRPWLSWLRSCLYVLVLAVLGRLDVFLPWVWIPVIVAGVAFGAVLDLGVRQGRPFRRLCHRERRQRMRRRQRMSSP